MIRMSRRIYRMLEPGIVYPYDSTVFLVEQSTHLSLIDTGTGLPGVYTYIVQGIHVLGLDVKPVRRVYNTHCHINNAGGDWAFHRYNGSTVAVHIGDAESVRNGDPDKTGARELGVNFKPTPVGLEIRGSSGVLEQDFVDISFIHTPGHTPGSVSYIVQDELRTIALIGDALGSLKKSWGSSVDDWYDSVDKVGKLEADIYCTSVKCYTKNEFRVYLDRVLSEGPIWM